MKQKIKYRIVRDFGDVDHVEKEVNELLEEGWELYGGLVVAVSTLVDDHEYEYYQVMTKKINIGIKYGM